MPLDIQVRNQVLLDLVKGTVQQRLNTICVDSSAPIFFDHADVATVTMTFTDKHTITFTVLVNVFTVDMLSLQKYVNRTPPGVLKPYDKQGTIKLALTVDGPLLTMTCTDAMPPGPPAAGQTTPDPQMQKMADQIKQSIDPMSVDLSSIFSGLTLVPPGFSSFVDLPWASSVLIRFDSITAPTDHLQPGEDWCMFIESGQVEYIVSNKLDGPTNFLKSLKINAADDASWAPHGTTPHVDGHIAANIQVPDPFYAHLKMNLGVDFVLLRQFQTNAAAQLLMVVDWSVTLDVADEIPQDLKDAINSAVTDAVSGAFDPTILVGATKTGPQEFVYRNVLPTLALGDAQFGYTSLVAVQDGMVLGGPVTGLPKPGTDIIALVVAPFPNTYTRYLNCSGGNDRPPTLDNVFTAAAASYTGAGQLCSVDLQSPLGGVVTVTPYLAVSPPAGPGTNTGSVSFGLPGPIGQELSRQNLPLEVLVKSARGVRLINFGVPPTPNLVNGHVTNLHFVIVGLCPAMVDPWYMTFGSFNPRWGVDPAARWLDDLASAAAFQSSLVTVTGVQAGEVLVFEQPFENSRSEFTAGTNGQAIVPMLAAVRSGHESASLSTMSRRPMGRVGMNTLLFHRVAVFNTPGAHSHEIRSQGHGAVVVSTFSRRIETRTIDARGGVRAKSERRSTNGPRPSASTKRGRRHPAGAWPVKIPGLVAVRSVPGFEQHPIAVAQLDDGTYRVLARDRHGAIRVHGRLSRWPHLPPVAGSWAISAASGDRVALFAVSNVSSDPPASKVARSPAKKTKARARRSYARPKPKPKKLR